ncbi:MAG: hypothetical protein U0270_00260 [Labilithrix sp.]
MKRALVSLGLGSLALLLACSDSSSGSSSSGSSGVDGGSTSSGGTSSGTSSGSSSGTSGGTGVINHLSGPTEVTDILGDGETAYFTGVEASGEGAIFSASATAGPSVLCKAGAKRTITAIAVDGTTLYGIRREPDTGLSAIVKTTTTGVGAACEEVGAIEPNQLTELVKVGDSLVYLGVVKVMRMPLTGGAPTELLTTAASGFIGDFASAGATGFVVDTSTAATPGARIARFTLGGAIETFVSVDSPSTSGHEIIGGKVVWAEPGPNAGDFVFKSADVAAALPPAPTPVVTSNFGIGSVLQFCRPNVSSPTELAVAAANSEAVDYHLIGSSSQPSRKLASISTSLGGGACALTTGAIWGVDPNDKRVFWASR